MHPAFRNSVKSAALLYDFQAQPENIELMTFQPNGVEPARQSRLADAAQLRRDGAAPQGACRPGRRSPTASWAARRITSPPRWSASAWASRCSRSTGPARAKALRDYFEEASRNDYFLTYVIINPQAERAKDWGEQAEDLVARIVDEDAGGITIRGAKMLGTSSIMANEVFVANLQPLKPGEEDLAFSCALPMNAKGLRVLSRKSYEAAAVSVFDNPLSSRFDENDALIYFDDVKVPWERVFVHRDTDMCRAQFHDTPGHAYQNYQAQIRLSVKIKFLCGLAHRITEAIGTTACRRCASSSASSPRKSAWCNAMMAGMEADGTMRGEWYVPNKHFMYSAQVLTQDLYPRVVNTMRELAGGALIMLPSSIHDFEDPHLAKIIRTTQRAAKMEPDEKVKFLKAAWDAIGSEFGSRHTQYEMFYAGARFVTTGHSYRTFDWAGATGMVDGLMRFLRPRGRACRSRARTAEAHEGRDRNLGQIVSGDWHEPFVAGRHDRHRGGRIVSVGTAAASAIESRRRGDRCRRHDGDPRPDRLTRARHLRRLHAAPAHRRLPRKLPARRHHDGDLGLRSARAGPAARRRRRQGARGRGAALLCGLPAGRHARHRRLGHPRARPERRRISRSSRSKGVRLAKAGFGAVKTAYDYVPLVADAKAARPDHHLPHRRLVDPGLGRDHRRSSARRCIRTCRSTSMAGRPRCRTRTSRASSARSTIALQVCTAGNLRTTLLCARLAEAARRVRPLHHRDRHADRQRHHAARHAVHDRASFEPDRHAARTLHLRRDRQQRAGLRPRQRLPRARQGRRHRAASTRRTAARRQTALAAIKHGDIAADRRGDHRRHPALRRAQPQHAGDDTQGARRALARHAGFRAQRRTDHAGRAHMPKSSQMPRWGQRNNRASLRPA